jgi:hypothetical protein
MNAGELGHAYAWRRTDESDGRSFARVAETEGGWQFDGTEILVASGRPIRTDFTVTLDRDWQTVEAHVSALTERAHELHLEVDRHRRWLVNGEPTARLDGCVDVDVAATPLTNTFPIRRYGGLEIGKSESAPVAWVEVPSLRVVRVQQRYRRLGEREWEYSASDHGRFRLTVDEDGIVVSYEGLAMRIAPTSGRARPESSRSAPPPAAAQRRVRRRA